MREMAIMGNKHPSSCKRQRTTVDVGEKSHVAKSISGISASLGYSLPALLLVCCCLCHFLKSMCH